MPLRRINQTIVLSSVPQKTSRLGEAHLPKALRRDSIRQLSVPNTKQITLEQYLAEAKVDLVLLNQLFAERMSNLLKDLRPIKGSWTLFGNKKNNEATKLHNKAILINYCQEINKLAKEALRKLDGEDIKKFLYYLRGFYFQNVLENKKLFPVSFDVANDFTEACSFVMNPYIMLNFEEQDIFFSSKKIFLEVEPKPVNKQICNILNSILSPLDIGRLENFPWTSTELDSLPLFDGDLTEGLTLEGLNYVFVAEDQVDEQKYVFGDSYNADSVIGHEMTHVLLDYLGCDSNRRTFRRYQDYDSHPFSRAQEYVAEMVACQFSPLLSLYNAIFVEDHPNFELSNRLIYETAKEFCSTKGFDLEQIDLDLSDEETLVKQRNNFEIFIKEMEKRITNHGLNQLAEFIKIRALEEAKSTVIQLKHFNAFDPHKIEQMKNLVLAA